MTPKNKLKMAQYFAGDICYCKEPKRHNRWMCADCTSIGMEIPQSEAADKACTAHFKEIIKWINSVQVFEL